MRERVCAVTECQCVSSTIQSVYCHRKKDKFDTEGESDRQMEHPACPSIRGSPAARCNTQIYHWGAVEGVCMYDLLWKPSQREKYAICKYLVKQMCDCPLMDEVV